MFKTFILILLFAHILGDYYFQSDRLAKQKNESIQNVIKHCVIYAVTCLVIAIFIYDKSVFIGCAFLVASHFLIDFSKYFYVKKAKKENINRPENGRTVYIVDQLLHLITMAIIAFALAANNYTIIVLPYINSIFKIIGISISTAFSWMLVLLLIWKPTNITIKKLINLHKPQAKEEEVNDDILDDEIKTGGFIGLLERLIILVLLSINQYSAIGLVLTAKSIARYDKISKDQAFAEYYLLGTLLSAIIVIITYLIVF